jgi:Ig-like domain from next to BRCA1 gene
MKFRSNLLLTITIIFALTLMSCSASNQSIIATSVALTVQAQNTQSIPATGTPMPPATDVPSAGTSTLVSTIIPFTPTPTLLPLGTPLGCSIVANLVSEDTPDGTIESPGSVFIKTWNVQNNGTCVWDTSWKIVYDKGDLMGAGYVYNFPQTVAPGQNVPIALQLTAPTNEGVYTGYWYLEAPNGAIFGVGQYSQPLWVKINVNSGTAGPHTPTVYGVTSVAYDYSTAFGKSGSCSPNVFLTTTATISASGPLKISYYWSQSDGGRGDLKSLTFTDASSVTIKDTWPLSVGHEIGLVWEEIVVTSPVQHKFANTYARYDHECQ